MNKMMSIRMKVSDYVREHDGKFKIFEIVSAICKIHSELNREDVRNSIVIMIDRNNLGLTNDFCISHIKSPSIPIQKRDLKKFKVRQ